MLRFPKLKTDAVAQYPAKKVLHFQNQVLRFVDGTEQRYRDCAGARRSWEIRLDQLDDGEMAAIDEFFVSSQGAFGSFTFTDPWDGQVYTDCSLDADGIELEALGEMRGRTFLRVRENRG